MTKQPPANLEASIHAQLLATAKLAGEDFQATLVRYGNERLLARIATSVHATKFVLKGAALFALWTDRPHRPTRDIDLHGSGANAPEDVARVFSAICDQPDDEDGLKFHSDTVTASVIREDQEYEGVRVTMLATLGRARIPLQVDVGFGDAVFPAPAELDLPSMLGLPPATLRTYRRETVVAEKFHAMVVLGMGNSRMKDFFDVWVLQRDFSMDSRTLAEAIRQTFARRRTSIPTAIPLALTATFSEDAGKQVQWRAFLNKSKLVAPELPVVVSAIAAYLVPLLRGLGGLADAASASSPGSSNLKS